MSEHIEQESGVHLYFMHNALFDMVKIGISNDIEKRRQALSCGCGVNLAVLRVVNNGAQYEKALHHIFHQTRLMGEWFVADDELLRVTRLGPFRLAAFIEANDLRRIYGANSGRSFAGDALRTYDEIRRQRAVQRADELQCSIARGLKEAA